MPRRPTAPLAPAVLLAAFAVCAPARAHLGHMVLRAERYLKVDVAPHEVRVVVSVMLGPSESPRVLRVADTSHDGQVDEQEMRAYVDGWAQELSREVTITVDGAPADGVAWRDGAISPLGPVVTQELVSVELVAHVPLAGGEHTISVTDGMDLTRFERTDVAFTARDGATLLACGVGHHPRDNDPALWFGLDNAPPDPRTFTARVATSADPAPPAWAVVAGVSVLLLVGVGVALGARRRRPQRENG